MRILLAEPLATTSAFRGPLAALIPDAEVRDWVPGDDEAADVLVTWLLPKEMVRTPPQLRAVFCYGAGADQLLGDPRLPADVPVSRLIDPGQAQRMLDYAAGAAFWRLLDRQFFAGAKAAGRWSALDDLPGYPRARSRLGVAVLGLGAIGTAIAAGLDAMGFTVRAWSRRARPPARYQTLYGPDGLAEALDRADVVVNVLPAVPFARGLLGAEAFARLAPGALIVNIGRGDAVDEEALAEALATGRVGGAWLDVFGTEPLPVGHWMWSDPRVQITPHVAGLPDPAVAAAAVAALVEALKAGTALPALVPRQPAGTVQNTPRAAKAAGTGPGRREPAELENEGTGS